MFAKQYHQIKTTQADSNKLLRKMHIIMIVLCLLATLLLISIPSTVSKILISLIIIAYTVVIFMRPRVVRSLFQCSAQTNEQNYSQVQPWNSMPTPNQSMQMAGSSLPNNTNFMKEGEGDVQLNGSLSKEYSRSQDIKNMSMSIYRSLSASGISQSRLGRIRSSQKRMQNMKGFDLEDANAFKTKEQLSKSSAKTSSGIVLVDQHSHLEKATKKNQEEAQSQFEKVLNSDIKKDRKWMSKRYEAIQDYIKATLNSHYNEHRFTREKIKMLLDDAFEVTIDENISQTYDINTKGNYLHQKIPYNVFLYRLFLLKSNKITYSQAQLPLKAGQRWSHLQPRLEAYIESIVKLAEQLGVDISLLKSHFKSKTRHFLENYMRSIDLIETYLKQEKIQTEESKQNMSPSLRHKLSKCKTFVVYLTVRDINSNPEMKQKVQFQDNLGLKYPHYQQHQLSIIKKVGTEDPRSHYDVFTLNNKTPEKKIPCEPGDNNFLSVIYFVLRHVSKNIDHFSWNSNLRALISQLL